MYLFESWKASLALFFPKNAHLFALVTLKRIAQSYSIIFRDLWWLIITAIVLEIMNVYYLYLATIWTVAIFIFYLIIRPSIKRKSWDYYKDYGKHSLLFIIMTLIFIFNILYILILFYLVRVIHINYFIVHAVLLLPGGFVYLSPWLSFILLFLLDSPITFTNFFKSWVRGTKMVVYNYPFCFIVVGLLMLIAQAFSLLFYEINYYFIAALALPIGLCLWTNFYTKRLHDQFSLYFPETLKE